MTDKSAYAYFRRTFTALWKDPEQPVWMKLIITIVAFLSGIIASVAVPAYRGWKRIARRDSR